jgi:hypothetical protein
MKNNSFTRDFIIERFYLSYVLQDVFIFLIIGFLHFFVNSGYLIDYWFFSHILCH